MRLKITPLIVAAMGIIVYGLYYIFYKWDTNIGPIPGLLLIVLGVLCVGIYFIVHIILHKKLWLQFIVEIMFVTLVVFWGYKLACKVILKIPPGFKGDIMLIYGVKNAPLYKPNAFYMRNIEVEVPPSGIVLMANHYAEKYLNNLLIIDSAHHLVAEPGNQLHYNSDTLNCGGKSYNVEVVNYQFPANTGLALADSVNRYIKKAQAVKLIGN